MSLFQRKDSPNWWIKIIAHDGRRIQQSTGTADKAKAQELHDKLKASMWDQARLGIKPRHAWNEAVVRYLAETTHKASQCSDKAHLRWLDRFLNGRMLDEINRELLDSIMAARMAEKVANSSVNRVNEVIRAVLRKACNEWEWIDRVPRIRMLPEPNRRVRWIIRIRGSPVQVKSSRKRNEGNGYDWATLKRKRSQAFNLTPCFIGAPEEIRTPYPLVRS